MSQAGGEKELILGNKQLISLFFVVIALCGVFFAMGYMVRGNALKGSVSTSTDVNTAAAASTELPKRQQPEAPQSADPTPADPSPASTGTANPAPTETRPALDTPPPAPASESSLPKPEEKPAPASEGGSSFVVQVAALARADAESTARTLREQKLPATVAPSSREGLYRVLVGPYHTTTDVANIKARLKGLGFGETIVQKQ
jgi:cell division protein FtsN